MLVNPTDSTYPKSAPDNNFFYRDFENKTAKIRKMNICERGITVHFVYFCTFAALA